MEELPALTTSKCNQLAPFVIVRIQFTCFHMDSDKRKNFRCATSLKSLKKIFPRDTTLSVESRFICSILDSLRCADLTLGVYTDLGRVYPVKV